MQALNKPTRQDRCDGRVSGQAGRRFFHGLLLAALVGPAAAQPTPAPGIQDPQAVIAQIHDLLRNQAASRPGTPLITVDEPRITRQAACTRMETFLPGGAELRSRTSVGVRCLEPESWTLYVQANVQIMANYFVAARTINRGETLGRDDLETREGDLLRNRRLILDASHLIGQIATRRIPRGTPIQGNALRDPQSIERGTIVHTEARGPGFRVTGKGQALESGPPGSQIQIRTPSGQVITGTVINAQTVQVMM